MRHALILGAVLALGVATGGYAQSAAPVPAAAASNYDLLKTHLKSGAEIYDPSGKYAGSISSVDPDKGIITIHEASYMGGTSILRILPMDTVSWTNGKLVTTILSRDVSKLKQG